MAPSGTSASPALVFEPYNGTVFYAEDPDAQWFPASLTKLMTAYVAFQALKAGTVIHDTKLLCSKEATEQAPSKLWLKVGESITFDVALKVLIVESANDVAVMIAEGVAGNQEAFVQRMNETAQHLGMRRTNFTNVNGLPDERQVARRRRLPLALLSASSKQTCSSSASMSAKCQNGPRLLQSRCLSEYLMRSSGRRCHQDMHQPGMSGPRLNHRTRRETA